MKTSDHKKNALPQCWCGNQILRDFSSDYFRCTKCETLVIKKFPTADLSLITDENTDLYGANYAEKHLHEDYGHPDFTVRSRQDLSARCLHWLSSILKYKLPPSVVLELGSFHGGFVGLAKLAGYQVRGLDLSPALCKKAATMFDVEILVGSLDRQSIPPDSLDVIALFDVLEHVQDPRSLFELCRKLLRHDGILVIQTPCYKEGLTYAEKCDAKDKFLHLFIPEHLHLFSKTAVARLLVETGFPEISFDSAMFDQYDMFPFASAIKLEMLTKPDQEAALLSSPGGRFAMALLDLKTTADNLLQENHRLNVHAQRCENEIISRTSQVNILTRLTKTHENDATARAEQVKQLATLVKQHETESANRAGQIDKLTVMLKAATKDGDARADQIKQLTALVKQHETESANRAGQIDILTTLAKSYEADNNSLHGQIASYAQWLKDAQTENQALVTAHRGAEMTALAALKELEQLKHSRQSGG
jgi:SAM-dependent methyltransferase